MPMPVAARAAIPGKSYLVSLGPPTTPSAEPVAIHLGLTDMLLSPGANAVLPKEASMEDRFEEMLKLATMSRMTPDEREAQRRSFAFGNAKIENDRVTREMIDKAADAKPCT